MHLHYSIHGLVVLFLGMLGGYPFAKAIKSNNGQEIAWRVVHSGGSMAGVMLIAIGLVVNQFNLLGISSLILFHLFVMGTYSLVGGMILAAITGARGLDRKQETRRIWNLIIYGMYSIGGAFSIIATAALIIMCFITL